MFADRFAALDFEPLARKVESVVDRIFGAIDFDTLANGITTIFNKISTLFSIVVRVGGVIWNLRGLIIGVAAAWGIYKVAMLSAVVIGPIIGMVRAVQALMAAQKGMNAVQALFNILLKANPIGLIITGIGLLIGLIILAYQRIEPFRNIVNSLFERLRALGAHIARALTPVFNTIRGVIARVGGVFSEIIGTVGRVISIFFSLFQATGNATGGFALLDIALNIFSTKAQIAWTIIGGLVDIFGKLFSGINDVIDAFSNGGFLAGIKQIGASLLRFILTPIRTILSAISFIPGIGDRAREAAEKIADFQESLRFTRPEEIAPGVNTASTATETATPSAVSTPVIPSASN